MTNEGEQGAASCAKQFAGYVQIPGQRVGLSILDVWAINELCGLVDIIPDNELN